MFDSFAKSLFFPPGVWFEWDAIGLPTWRTCRTGDNGSAGLSCESDGLTKRFFRTTRHAKWIQGCIDRIPKKKRCFSFFRSLQRFPTRSGSRPPTGVTTGGPDPAIGNPRASSLRGRAAFWNALSNVDTNTARRNNQWIPLSIWTKLKRRIGFMISLTNQNKEVFLYEQVLPHHSVANETAPLFLQGHPVWYEALCGQNPVIHLALHSMGSCWNLF